MTAEPTKKENRKNKKKRFQRQNWKYTGERKKQTLITNINIVTPKKKNKK